MERNEARKIWKVEDGSKVSARLVTGFLALVILASGLIVPVTADAAPPGLTKKTVEARFVPQNRVEARRNVGNSWNSCVSARQAAYTHTSAICGDEDRIAWYDFERCDRNPTGYSTIEISYNCFSDK